MAEVVDTVGKVDGSKLLVPCSGQKILERLRSGCIREMRMSAVDAILVDAELQPQALR